MGNQPSTTIFSQTLGFLLPIGAQKNPVFLPSNTGFDNLLRCYPRLLPAIDPLTNYSETHDRIGRCDSKFDSTKLVHRLDRLRVLEFPSHDFFPVNAGCTLPQETKYCQKGSPRIHKSLTPGAHSDSVPIGERTQRLPINLDPSATSLRCDLARIGCLFLRKRKTSHPPTAFHQEDKDQRSDPNEDKGREGCPRSCGFFESRG